MVHAGGSTQAEAAFAEAYTACFDLQVDCHQLVQQQLDDQDGKVQWVLLQMWPMLVGALTVFAVIVNASAIWSAVTMSTRQSSGGAPAATSGDQTSRTCPRPARK